jgi:valyl-tRNA synthetase
MIRIQSLITTVRARRKELGVPEKEQVGLFIVADAGSGIGSTKPEINDVYEENEDMILRLARVSTLEHKPFSFLEAMPDLGWIPAFGPEVAVLYARQIDVPAERERLTKELARLNKGLEAANKQLGNEGFIARAPANIVEGLRKQHAETLALKEKAEAALAALPPE